MTCSYSNGYAAVKFRHHPDSPAVEVAVRLDSAGQIGGQSPHKPQSFDIHLARRPVGAMAINSPTLNSPTRDAITRPGAEDIHWSPASALRLGDPASPEARDVSDYVKTAILPQLVPPPYGEIEIVQLSSRKPVYLFVERNHDIGVVGKLFRHGEVALEQAWLSASREYFNLKLLRNRFGMSSGSCCVVAPLGKRRELSALLVTERARGRELDRYIAKAIKDRSRDKLYEKLSDLATFFVKLHRSTEGKRQVSACLPRAYLTKLLDSLRNWPSNPIEGETVERYAARWWDKDEAFVNDTEVVVHGDATTTNFLFHHHEVTAIDLEKMKWADRCWDLGFIAAELKHHFMWRMGDGWAAEPFIGHFLWQYATGYRDEQFFHSLTNRTPLYMALGLLRIARNSWLDERHRKNLVIEAIRCLSFGASSSTTTIPS